MNNPRIHTSAHFEPGSARTRASRPHRLQFVLAALLVALTSIATLVVAGVSPASASTLNGIATLATPGTSTPLPSGGSTTSFTVSLPAQSACSGDTASGGYHVYSYLVPRGTNLSTVTFVGFPSTGYGFVDNTGLYYGPVNTAINTGQIIGIPNNFQWGPLVTTDGGSVALSSLLYTGGTTGVWEAGLACADTHGALSDNWNTEVTFNAKAGDPNGFTWTAVPGPSGSQPAAITSATSTTFTQGVAGSFTVAATGTPTPTISESGALPAGVTFTPATGVLAGTPTVSGTFPITFTAHNGIETDATQNFTLTVGVPAAITSANSTAFTQGAAGTFTVTATGTPAPTLSESGALPSGVTFTPATGALAGTPTVGGTFPITFTAHNGIGTDATQNFTLTVGVPAAITSATSTTFTKGSAGTFTVTATGTPAPTLSESGALPSGVTFTPATGALAGTPTVGGTFPITFTAHNGIGTDGTQSFTLTVNAAPAITSANSTTFTQGAVSSFTVTGTGTPAPTLSESGALPSGVTFTPATGALAGTPTASGTFPITFTAHNGIGTDATQSFTLTVNAAPAITSAASTTFTQGSAGTFTVTATGSPAPTLSESGALPSGVTFTAATGVLAGTPTAGGTFPITFIAHNGIGTDATQNFTLTVDAPATITSAASTTFTKGTAGTFTVTVTGTPVPTITESGTLPAGVTFGVNKLVGTPTETGAFPVTFTAHNGIGTDATQSFTLTVHLPPLVLTTSSLPGGTVGSAYSKVLGATGGQSPYAWSVATGTLPAGLSLDATSGVISGTPTIAATSAFRVAVTDADATVATKSLSIVVSSAVTPAVNLTGPTVGIASTPEGNGYWLADSNGDVAPHGAVQSYGSLAGVHLNAPIVHIVSTSDGKGYWLVGADGGIFAFGDAAFYGSMGGKPLNAPVVDLATTGDSRGYWLVAADGGIFAFGDAQFRGSMAGRNLNQPIVGIASDGNTGGYWEVAADGGIFAFHAPFQGSTGSLSLNAPIRGIAATTHGHGYLLAAADGGIFAFGDAQFHGASVGIPGSAPIVGIAGDGATGGYWLANTSGGVYAFDAPFYGAG